MDVIINEVVSTVRLIDTQSLLDRRTLSTIVRAVTGAIDERDERRKRREEEARIEDDGRGGLRGATGMD